MIKRALATVGALVLLLSLPVWQAVSAEPDTVASTQLCLEQFALRLARQERFYYQALLGRIPAAQNPPNTVLYDEEGTAWMKTLPGVWTEIVNGRESGRTMTDSEMDEKREWDGMNETEQEGDDADPSDAPNLALRANYKGIFQQEAEITSQKIPRILQSARAVQCRAKAEWLAVWDSYALVEPSVGGKLKINAPGCRTMLMKPLTGCAFGNEEQDVADQKNMVAGINTSVVNTQGPALITQMMARIQSQTETLVSYDAAYRSLLQFSGSLDQFLWGFRGSILSPIEQTLPLLENITRIPCFTSQCNG